MCWPGIRVALQHIVAQAVDTVYEQEPARVDHLRADIFPELADVFDRLAQELRDAHQALGEITGEVSSDDLLGRIFSSFCIGK
jgi:tRNA modification GTPase